MSLLEEWAALKAACREVHRGAAKGSPGGGQVACACGLTGSSDACSMLARLKSFFGSLDESDLGGLPPHEEQFGLQMSRVVH
jgi:hypothetical protein